MAGFQFSKYIVLGCAFYPDVVMFIYNILLSYDVRDNVLLLFSFDVFFGKLYLKRAWATRTSIQVL